MSGPALEVRDLRMRCGDVEAVRGIDLDVVTGEVFAFPGSAGLVVAARRFRSVPQGVGA
jgi:ABC-type histidine transport system ATPase subunit